MTDNLTDIDKVEKILAWYSNNCDTSELSLLMIAADKLSILSCDLAKSLGDVQTEYNSLYFIRRISTSKTVNKLVKEGLAVSKADHQSLVENQEVFNSEKEKESEAFKMSLILKQVNKVLDRMNQRISLMKIELSGK